MSRSVNKVIIVGNVGNDPDIRNLPSGDLVANISIATSESWNDRQTGELREKTEWHRIALYRGLAGVVQQYVRKGSKLYIEGKLQTRKWTDQSGLERYSVEIIADNMLMLDGRSGDGEYGEQRPQRRQTMGKQQQGYQQGRQQAYQQQGFQQQGYAVQGNRQQGYQQKNQRQSSPHIGSVPPQGNAPLDDFGDNEIPF